MTLYYNQREHLIACEKHKKRLRDPVEVETAEKARCWFCLQEKVVGFEKA